MLCSRALGNALAEQSEKSVARFGERVALVLCRRQLVLHSGQDLTQTGRGEVHLPHGAEYFAAAVGKNEVRVFAHHLGVYEFFAVVAHFVAPVEFKARHAFKARLRRADEHRADKMLAHQHTERRRDGGIVGGLGGIRHARVVCAAAHKQAASAVACAQTEYHGVVLRLIYLVDPRACRAAVKLVDNCGEHSGIICHIK